MSEKDVITRFKRNKKEMIKILGRESTSDKQLTGVGKKLFGKKYIGTFPQNYKVKPTPVNQYFIINTDTAGKAGVHWVAIVKNKNTYYIYDSFARKAKKLLPIFTKGKIVVNSDTTDQEQFGNSEICGALCLSWLMVVHECGIRAALLI